MTYVKAYTSERARKFLATSQGRRRLLELYLNRPAVTEESQGSAIKSFGPGIDKDGKPSA